MKRPVRIGAIVLGVLLAIWVIFSSVVDVNDFRPKLEAELTAALNREVKIGQMSLSIVSGKVSANDISIADDKTFSANPFITAKSFRAGVKIRPLIFSKSLHVTEISLDEPQITLLRGPSGVWNFSGIGSKSAPSTESNTKSGEGSGAALAVDRLHIRNGRLIVGATDSGAKPAIYDKVALEVTGFSPTSQFPFKSSATLPGSGNFALEGKCGPIPPGGAGSMPFQANLNIEDMAVAASGFIAPSTGIDGVADFDGTVGSDGQQLTAGGTLRVEKLKLAVKGQPMKRAVTVKYALDHNLKADSGALTQGEVAIGKAAARISGSYQTQGQVPSINMKFSGSDMPVDELAAALPAIGVVLPSGSQLRGGTFSADLSISGRTDALVIAGPVRLANAKLDGFDLGSKLSAVPALAGKTGKDTTLQNLSMTVRTAPEITQANAINVTIPSLGTVAGTGTIGPSAVLNFDLKADLANRSGSGVPFRIEGTASDPKFVADVKAIAGGAIARKVTGGESPRSTALARRRR